MQARCNMWIGMEIDSVACIAKLPGVSKKLSWLKMITGHIASCDNARSVSSQKKHQQPVRDQSATTQVKQDHEWIVTKDIA
jgi:hypothetical protein